MKRIFITHLCFLSCLVNAMAVNVYFPGNKIPIQPLIDIRGGILHVVVIVSNATFKTRPSKKK